MGDFMSFLFLVMAVIPLLNLVVWQINRGVVFERQAFWRWQKWGLALAALWWGWMTFRDGITDIFITRGVFAVWAIGGTAMVPALLAGYGQEGRRRMNKRLSDASSLTVRAAEVAWAKSKRHPLTWAVIAFLVVLPFSDKLAALVAQGILLFLAVRFFLYLFNAKPSKDQLDPLSSTKAKEAAQSRAKIAPSEGVWAGQTDGKDLFVSIEDRAVVIGPPGTGKTAFLVGQLLRWAETGRPFVVVDIKPEIYGIVRKELEEKGYRLLTYNPTAGTGERYNPVDDLDGPEAVGELASSLIPSNDERNAVFNESARDFLDAVISHLQTACGKRPTLVDVRNFVGKFDEFKELHHALMESPDPDVREIASALGTSAKNERLLGSIFGIFRANLRFMRYPMVRESLSKSDFSLSDLCQPKVGLFLQFEERHREVSARLWSALMGHMLRYFITNTVRPPVLFLLDEIGNASPMPGLVSKLNTIRSRHMPVWMYWQSKEQMQPYGEKADQGPNTILGACDFQMIFRLNDNATARWFSEKIGTVDRVVTSVSRGADWVPGTSESLQTQPVIPSHELQQLADGEVVCAYRGATWKGAATPYYLTWPRYRDYKPSPESCVGPRFDTMSKSTNEVMSE